ncbi:uncharacterized protein TNCV_703621 [Trichonephila clavipes]|nr:uncharacterized protein TNCV_703621 [Trichonephila clavipes]
MYSNLSGTKYHENYPFTRFFKITVPNIVGYLKQSSLCNGTTNRGIAAVNAKTLLSIREAQKSQGMVKDWTGKGVFPEGSVCRSKLLSGDFGFFGHSADRPRVALEKRVTQVGSELQRRMTTGIWQLLQKETDGAQPQISLASSFEPLVQQFHGRSYRDAKGRLVYMIVNLSNVFHLPQLTVACG